jgi:hypothetical protein
MTLSQFYRYKLINLRAASAAFHQSNDLAVDCNSAHFLHIRVAPVKVPHSVKSRRFLAKI